MAVLGLRGTGQWPANYLPDNWREQILFLFPRSNQKCPLMALMSMLSSEDSDSKLLHWWEEGYPLQRLTLAADATSTALTFTVTETNGALITRRGTKLINEETGEIFVAQADGSGVTITTTLAFRGFGDVAAAAMTAGQHLTVIGSVQSEGDVAPTPLSNNPTQKNQYIEIIKETFGLTDDARLTRTRAGDPWPVEQFRALVRWGVQAEKSFFFSNLKTATDATTGYPIYSQQGFKSVITTNVKNNWGLISTKMWDDFKMQVQQYASEASPRKLILCGNVAFGTIFEIESQRPGVRVNTAPGNQTYGVELYDINTPWGGSYYLQTHPIFNENPWLQGAGAILDLPNLKYRYFREKDLQLYEDILKDNHPEVRKDEWNGHCAIEVHHEPTHAWFDGITGWTQD